MHHCMDGYAFIYNKKKLKGESYLTILIASVCRQI